MLDLSPELISSVLALFVTCLSVGAVGAVLVGLEHLFGEGHDASG